MKLHKQAKTAILISLLTAMALFSGCVVSKTDENYIGPQKSQLRQIDYGRTTKDQLIEMFGQPAEQSVMQDGTEILSYKSIKEKDNSFVMFPPPIVIQDKKAEENIISFEIRDGVVQRYRGGK